MTPTRHTKDAASAQDTGFIAPSALILSSSARAWLAIGLGYAAAIVLAVQHLFIGVDLQDETYYIALAYRFAKGATPFVSESSLHQFAALLEAPLVRAYVGIVGSTEGIVLAARFAYLGVLLLMIVATVAALRRLIGWRWAAAACLPIVFYAPMAISGLSYNSIATLAFLACCSWGMAAVLDSGTTATDVTCGLFGVLVIIAYPPWALAVVPTLVIYGVSLWRTGAKRRVVVLGGGLMLVSAVVAALLLISDPRAVLSSLELSALGRFRSGYGAQVVSIVRSVGAIVLGWPVPVLLAIVAVALRNRAKTVARLCLLLMVLSLVAIVVRFPWLITWVWTSTVIWYLGGLSFVLYWGVRDHARARTVLWTLCVPGLIAGLVVSFSSLVGEGVAGQGLLPAAVGGTVFVLWLVGVGNESGSPDGAAVLSAVGYIAALAFCLWFLQSNVVFNDVSPGDATARVERGPWRGLLTSVDRRDMVTSLSEDVAALGTKDKRVLVLSGIPGAYLAAQGTITVPTVWLPYSGAGRVTMLEEQKKVPPPDFVIVDTQIVPTRADDPFIVYSRDNGFVVVRDRAWYQILARR